MTICKRCGRRGALRNDICPQCLRNEQLAHGSLPVSDFKEKYLKDPVSGIFYADDALLQYQSYKDDGRFTPLICGEYGGDYKDAHEELRRWYTTHFFSLLEQKISAESTFNPISHDPSYYYHLQKSFISFLDIISSVSTWPGDEKGEVGSSSIFLNYILKKILVDLRSNYTSDEELRAADPANVDLAASTFDAGSGFFLMELFFLIREKSVLQGLIDALNVRDRKVLESILHRPRLMVIPWKHQDEAISRWEEKKSGIVEMATATGKTVVGLMAIERLWEKNKHADVLILCHRNVILNQWRREVIQKLGIIANENRKYKVPVTAGHFRVQFETIQTVMKDPSRYHADLLIIDEVHHIAGEKFRRAVELPHKYRLGLTAQLNEGERKRAVTRNFGEIVYQYGLLEALKDGIIPEFSWVVHTVFLDIKEKDKFQEISSQISILFNIIRGDKRTIRVITGKEDYKITTIYDFVHLTERARYSGIEVPGNWVRLKVLLQKRRWIIHRSGPRLEKAREFAGEMADNHKVIIFLMDTESCDALALELKKQHENVFVIHSKIKEDPIRVVNKFRDVPNGILLGVEMLTEGIDIPDADVGINVAFTRTQLQLVQRMGRILRKDGTKKPQFFQFIAVPDESSSVEVIDAPEYIDDLSWVQSTAIRMGLDLDIVPDSEELRKYKSDAEDFICESYNTVTSNEQSFGTFNLRHALGEFDASAVKRMPEILALYGDNDISDRQWEDIIRTAYGNIRDDGVFEKARFVDAGRSWYILIIANRKGQELSKIFSSVKVSDDLRYASLPPLRLDDRGCIVSGNEDLSVGQKKSLMKKLQTSHKDVRSTVPPPLNVHLKRDIAAREIGISPVDKETTTSSTGKILEKILGAEGADELEVFGTAGEKLLVDECPDPGRVTRNRDTDDTGAIVTEERDMEDKNILGEIPVTSDSPEGCLILSLRCLRKGAPDEAISWMQKALQEYPDDKFIEHYRDVCKVAGRDPFGTAYEASTPGNAAKLRIPGLENHPLSAGEAKKWISAYEYGAVDTMLMLYQNEQNETVTQQKLVAGMSISEQELRCINAIRNHIYLLKLFVSN